MGILDKIFGGGKNPADAAMPYVNQISDTAKQNYNPYIDRGNQAYNKMQPNLDEMSTDPMAYYDKIFKGYEPSKSYQLQRDEMQRAAGNSAAAGGQRGSLGDITNQARLTDTLMGNDMQQWFKNVMGIQDKGMEGEGHLYDTGYDASKNLEGDEANALGEQGQLAFQGQREKNQRHSDLFSGLMSAFGAAAGGLAGGVPGAVAGSQIGSKFI